MDLPHSLLLGVNVDHIATLRQARYCGFGRSCGQMVEPDPVFFAQIAEKAGADGITVHLREDRRHMQEQDVFRMREALETRLNFEMACTDEMVDFAIQIKPEAVCLVPENRQEVTTEGGLDVAGQLDHVGKVVAKLAAVDIAISLFIDADPAQIEAARTVEANAVELHTGRFANHYYDAKRALEFDRLRQTAILARELGLVVNAGHGINYINIKQVKTLPHLHELNIGHSIISRALYVGLEPAVREMKRLMT